MESVRLSPKQALHVVRVGEEYFLVGATDQNVNLLSQVDLHKETDAKKEAIPVKQQSFETFLMKATELEEQPVLERR
jgi:flagellar biogenesis protein FliO